MSDPALRRAHQRAQRGSDQEADDETADQEADYEKTDETADQGADQGAKSGCAPRAHASAHHCNAVIPRPQSSAAVTWLLTPWCHLLVTAKTPTKTPTKLPTRKPTKGDRCRKPQPPCRGCSPASRLCTSSI